MNAYIIEQEATPAAHVTLLGAIVPMCPCCHKVRDEQGAWQTIAEYGKLGNRTALSHCMCPDCMRELYPEYIRCDTELVHEARHI